MENSKNPRKEGGVGRREDGATFQESYSFHFISFWEGLALHGQVSAPKNSQCKIRQRENNTGKEQMATRRDGAVKSISVRRVERGVRANGPRSKGPGQCQMKDEREEGGVTPLVRRPVTSPCPPPITCICLPQGRCPLFVPEPGLLQEGQALGWRSDDSAYGVCGRRMAGGRGVVWQCSSPSMPPSRGAAQLSLPDRAWRCC